MVKGKRILAFMLMLTMLITVAVPNTLAEGLKEERYKVITYLPAWESREWKVDDIQGDKLTHVYLSFARIDNNFRISDKEMRIQVQVDGKIVALPDIVSSDMIIDETWDKVKKLQEKYPDLKVIVAVGGWEAEGFSDMVASEATREIFVDSVAKYIEEHNLDGIDLDWEYPVNGAGGVIKSRPQDKQNFTELIKRLRQKLGKDKEISFCASVSGWFLEVIDFEKVVPLVDSVNLMAYDYQGSWSENSAHHTNLYNNPKDPVANWGLSTSEAVDRLIKKGIPEEKIIMGAAAYGREFCNVPKGPNGDGLFQKFMSEDKTTWRGGTIPYKDLKDYYIGKCGFKRYWDDVAKAPYLYDGKTFISYDDKESITAKCEFIKEKNLQGVMYWEYVSDLKGDLLTVMHENLNK